MGISGTDLALVTARVGRARVGAFRVGFIPCFVKGAGAVEPGEYGWDEIKPPTTTWTLVGGDCLCAQAAKDDQAWAEDPSGGPTASFTFNPIEGGLVGERIVDFTDTTSGGTGPYTYSWDFGDGVGTSTDQNPQYTFQQGGGANPQTFLVVLTVTDDDGNVDTYQTTVIASFNT
jgi:PKD repeat protein